MDFCLDFKLRRLVWCILVLAALGVLISSTVQQVMNYLKFEHVTKYDIDFVSTLGKLTH